MAQNTAQKLWDLAEPFARQLELDIWDTEFIKEGTEHYLRVYIDREGGVGVDDCEALATALSEPLDAADLVAHSYIFEVCSPGVERRLRLDWQFERYIGEKILVKCYQAVDGKKEISGLLKEYTMDHLTIECDGLDYVIDKKNLSRARTVFEF